MNDVRFTLKDPKVRTKSLILAIFYFGNGQRIKLSTGISLSPSHWNVKKKSIKSGYVHQYDINKQLADFAVNLQKLLFKLEEEYGKGKVTSVMLKNEYLRQKADNEHNDMGVIEIYNKYLIRKSRLIGDNSIHTYNTTLKHLKDYEKKIEFFKLEHFDAAFYDNYCGFCFDTLRLAPNTVGRDMKNLKAFIRDLQNQGLAIHVNSRMFKSISVPSFSIALNEEELEKIYNLDLSSNTRLNQVRIKFLLACYTGMRIGDLFRLSAGNITESTFEYVQGKTGERVFLPRHDALNRIIAMLPNDYKLTEISEQRYNQYLKQLCELAGMTEEMQVPKYQGRKKVFLIKKKFELVSSHTARKTFATIGITKGIPAETLMKFTGHDNLTSFLKYVKMPPSLYMDVIRNAWSKK